MNEADFTKNVQTCVSGIVGRFQELEKLIHIALDHLANNDFQVCYLQIVNDALKAQKNKTKWSAYLKWMNHFLPIRIHNDKIKKSDERCLKVDWEGKKADIIAEAKKTFYLDFMPDQGMNVFNDYQKYLKQKMGQFDRDEDRLAFLADAHSFTVEAKVMFENLLNKHLKEQSAAKSAA